MWNIAIQPAVGCYNSWANLRCSGCYPLEEKLWNRSNRKQLCTRTDEKLDTCTTGHCTMNGELKKKHCCTTVHLYNSWFVKKICTRDVCKPILQVFGCTDVRFPTAHYTVMSGFTRVRCTSVHFTNVRLYKCPVVQMSDCTRVRCTTGNCTNVRLYMCPLYNWPLYKWLHVNCPLLYTCPLYSCATNLLTKKM